jgi:hypothetical protein
MVRVDHLSGLDRQLGYRGEDRFVLFYYDESADGLVWKDRHQYGFGSWIFFDQKVEPLLQSLAWHTHQVVLLMDRALKQAFLVKQNSSVRWNGILIGKALSPFAHELAVA